jgi:hypothetical protein
MVHCGPLPATRASAIISSLPTPSVLFNFQKSSISQFETLLPCFPALPNPPLNSDSACIAFPSLSESRDLGFTQRLGAGGAG